MQHKVIFFGTPEIAQAVLKTLLTVQDIKVIAAVCQPDRPSNRNKVVFSPVKELCLAKNIPLFQPTKLSEIKQQLLDLSPDLIITCAYGLLVPPSILAIPKYKCVNVHPSLLPKYRGPAPINYVIFNQEKTTGVTLMYMDKDMDTGDIIVQSSPIPLATGETYSSLYEKLTKVSCDLILKHISSFFTPNLPTTTQNHALATYSQLIDKNITKIN
jgi:methionyl-tRNA formyltransferase